MKECIRLAAAALLVSASLSGCGDTERYRAEEQFDVARKGLLPSVQELIIVPAKTDLSDQPYIKGKIAVFTKTRFKNGGENLGGYQSDIFYFRGLTEVYAARPGEVGTVALVDCHMVDKGVYKTDDGKEFPAEVKNCGLTMIDRSKGAVIFRKMFEVDPGAETKVYGNNVVQKSAALDVLPFLQGLPRT